ncbi:hypothetical protein ATEIFO6365_0011033500 [Aspergillus terreus]|uniref:HNH nuclease domain-containing protein n=1 Tax=Aspergillus terreus TaxID=33178 RepID=A0A5M3Z0P8_ASPTE|nr:hypothetical protein ATETN484_0006033500 [Aspergillus terreus]GFF20075.1 hypothetical protein ATEIFO6365_0011033500 [Aspergillus terreus]
MSSLFLSQGVDVTMGDFGATTTTYDKVPDVAGSRRSNGRLLFVRKLKTPWVEAHSLGNIPTERKRREILGQIAEYMQETVDTTLNQMCLCPNIHRMWTDGKCAFRPFEYNDDQPTLGIEWHWQPTIKNTDSVIAGDTPSPSSRNLEQHVYASGGHNPNRLPLPSKALLDMAFVLAGVVNLSGAAGYLELLNFDDCSDDDDVPVVLPGEETGIMDWLTQVKLNSGRSDSGDSDDETGTQAT